MLLTRLCLLVGVFLSVLAKKVPEKLPNVELSLSLGSLIRESKNAWFYKLSNETMAIVPRDTTQKGSSEKIEKAYSNLERLQFKADMSLGNDLFPVLFVKKPQGLLLPDFIKKLPKDEPAAVLKDLITIQRFAVRQLQFMHNKNVYHGDITENSIFIHISDNNYTVSIDGLEAASTAVEKDESWNIVRGWLDFWNLRALFQQQISELFQPDIQKESQFRSLTVEGQNYSPGEKIAHDDFGTYYAERSSPNLMIYIQHLKQADTVGFNSEEWQKYWKDDQDNCNSTLASPSPYHFGKANPLNVWQRLHWKVFSGLVDGRLVAILHRPQGKSLAKLLSESVHSDHKSAIKIAVDRVKSKAFSYHDVHPGKILIPVNTEDSSIFSVLKQPPKAIMIGTEYADQDSDLADDRKCVNLLEKHLMGVLSSGNNEQKTYLTDRLKKMPGFL